MLYWWEGEDGGGAELRDPHQHDGVFSALACMESAQREWQATDPGTGPNLHLTQLDSCIASPMPEDSEAQIRAAFDKRRKSEEAQR